MVNAMLDNGLPFGPREYQPVAVAEFPALWPVSPLPDPTAEPYAVAAPSFAPPALPIPCFQGLSLPR